MNANEGREAKRRETNRNSRCREKWHRGIKFRDRLEEIGMRGVGEEEGR